MNDIEGSALELPMDGPSGAAAGELAAIWQCSSTGRMAEGLARARELLRQATEQADPPVQAGCHYLIAFCCAQLGMVDEGLEHARDGGAIFRQLGEIAGEAKSRAIYAWLLLQRADSELGLDEALRALSLARRSGDPVTETFALNVMGIVYWLVKQLEKALTFLEEAVTIAEHLNDDLHLGRVLANQTGALAELGTQARDRGDLDAGRHYLSLAIATGERGLAAARRCGDLWSERLLLCNQAEFYCETGDFAAAQACLNAHDALGGTPGPRATVHYQYTRGLVLLGMGLFEEAIAYLEQSLSTESTGDIEQAVQTCQQLALAFEWAGRYQEALHAYKRFHDMYVRMAEQAVQRRAHLAAVGFENHKLRAEAEAQQRRMQVLEVEKLNLLQETERLSRTVLEDSLTNLPNRRRLEHALCEAVTSAERYVIAMIDVDHFKQVNDTYSHLSGDEVLRHIAHILRACCRPQDVPARYGGEEFAVLVRDADPAIGRAICERMRAEIENHDWLASLGIPGVTISIGAASSDEADTPNHVLLIADKRLYVAKAGGRNRVVHDETIRRLTVS